MVIPSASIHPLKSNLGCKISAPAMVYGHDTIYNINMLGPLVDNVEIVLFYTPELNNFPQTDEVAAMCRLGEAHHLTFTVHLPAFLEIASDDDRRLRAAVQMAINLIRSTARLRPLHYVLHVSFTVPTLVADPDQYFDTIDDQRLTGWIKKAKTSLSAIHNEIGEDSGLLLENINYSPAYLAKLLENGPYRLCLDIGHLLLGKENVAKVLRDYLPMTDEIHLHGVRGSEEHLGLGVLSTSNIAGWMNILKQQPFTGVINLEVFTPEDLKESLEITANCF